MIRVFLLCFTVFGLCAWTVNARVMERQVQVAKGLPVPAHEWTLRMITTGTDHVVLERPDAYITEAACLAKAAALTNKYWHGVCT